MIRKFWIVWPNQDKRLLALYTLIWTYPPEKFPPKISRNRLLLLLKVIDFFGNCSGWSFCNPIQKLRKDNIIRTELAHQLSSEKWHAFASLHSLPKLPICTLHVTTLGSKDSKPQDSISLKFFSAPLESTLLQNPLMREVCDYIFIVIIIIIYLGYKTIVTPQLVSKCVNWTYCFCFSETFFFLYRYLFLKT